MKIVTKEFTEYEVGDQVYLYLFSGYGPHLIAKCEVEEVVRAEYHRGIYREPQYRVRVKENYLGENDILRNRYKEGIIKNAVVSQLMIVWEGQ